MHLLPRSPLKIYKHKSSFDRVYNVCSLVIFHAIQRLHFSRFFREKNVPYLCVSELETKIPRDDIRAR